MKLNFPTIGLSEHKIGRNISIYNISLPSYAFCFDETKSSHVGTGFFINKSYLYTKNLGSTFIEINLPKKRIFLCGYIYRHPHVSIADFNLTGLTPILEKLNKKTNCVFWWVTSIFIRWKRTTSLITPNFAKL